ncbi:unnamed protein product [Effrenium voratum]|nr:unnamed protein product [Effrenium voratum]
MRPERRAGGLGGRHRTAHRGSAGCWCPGLLSWGGHRAAGRGLLLNHWPLHGGFPGCARCSGNASRHLHGGARGSRGEVAGSRQASRGWTWDAETGTWNEPKVYSLPEEAEEVLAGEDDEGEEEVPRRVVDSYYYDQLGVPSNASQQEIRRAYFQKSRQCHPDKTTEADAKERFQAVSEAYQVLSDPKRRRDYDSRGRSQQGFIDAKIFFSVLLGADALAPFIGRLRISEMFGQDFFEGGGERKDKDTQVCRQVKLAVSLAERLDGIRTDAGRLEEAREEARGILERDGSQRFLVEIAWVYANRAEWYLASSSSALGSWSVGAMGSRAHSRGREASQQANTARLAVRSFWQLRRIVKEADSNEHENQEELPESLSSALPTFMETFWSLSAHDITNTLDKVIQRVLRDGSVDVEARIGRARALRDLGRALEAEAKAKASAPGGECQRFEKAFMASMAQ